MNYVYLIPHEDATYEACIAPTAPSEHAVILTEEGTYPVACYSRRIDINGSPVYEMQECANREELIEELNFHGEALHSIRALWEFDSYKAIEHDVWPIFNKAYHKVMEILDAAIAD